MKKLSLLSIIALCLSACSVIQKSAHTVELDEIILESPQNTERAYYQESPKRVNDLLHIQLAVSFDWNKKHLLGTAYLDFKPYFKAQNTLTLDAKGFDIRRVALVDEKDNKTDLAYSYDSLQIFIELNKEYTRDETYTVFIDYTAKPDELEVEGSAAITDAKGLYFINADGSEDKPMQIWTQGAPESNSAWFPSIDKPNERCTQEIAITVENKYTTLSNGLMVSSTKHADGTRTDIWKQELEHAPYLVMMAIGEFHITNDQWRDLDVTYYVEPDQAQHAQRIFGKTPAMMEFYSQILGFDYPWEKYAQVIVRDFVSGAMENTTAVIHGEFVYSDEREFIDDPNEMIIAHELFHHWFGDWVTCESWPNIPLNEGFATYGEYLWMEGKYSADAAAHYFHNDLISYMNESRRKQVNCIRFGNKVPDEMFDNHSYAKGGRILHMLRYSMGDEAFFKGLQLYLTEYANQAVEIHQLRLAMEKIAGEDLNWFFNQWFLASGHPTITIAQEINENTVRLKITQDQSLETTPLYKLPLSIDVYENGKTTTHPIELNKQEEVFEFKTSTRADLIVFDKDHYLLADISFEKTDEQWAYQLVNAPHYYDRMEALDSLANSENFASISRGVKIALKDPFWAIKTQALDYFEDADPRTQSTLEAQLINLAKTDEKSDVRAAAINILSSHFDQNENVPSRSHTKLYTKMSADPSYIVAGDALRALSFVDTNTAYDLAKKELNTAKKELREAAFYVIAKKGDLTDASLIQNEFNEAKSFDIPAASYNLLYFMEKQKPEVYIKPLQSIFQKIQALEVWYLRYYALSMLNQYLNEAEGAFKLEVEKIFKQLIALEKDQKVLQYLGAR